MQISVNKDQPKSCLDVSWRKDRHLARLVADMETKVFHVYCTRTAEDGELHCVRFSALWVASMTLHDCTWDVYYAVYGSRSELELSLLLRFKALQKVMLLLHSVQ